MPAKRTPVKKAAAKKPVARKRSPKTPTPVDILRSAEQGTIVQIIWRDAFSENQTWMEPDAVSDELVRVASVGYLLRVGDNAAIIVGSAMEGHVGGVLAIPLSWVTDVNCFT